MPEEIMQAVEMFKTLSDTATQLGIQKGKIKWEVDREGSQGWFGINIPFLEGFSQLFQALGGPKKGEIGWIGFETGPADPFRVALDVSEKRS